MNEIPTIGSLCSGYGGLEMGVELAIGPVRHAWHAEVDPDASAVLAGNWPGVPNLGDIPPTNPLGRRRTPDQIRAVALRILGNGAVPHQMAYGIHRALTAARAAA